MFALKNCYKTSGFVCQVRKVVRHSVSSENLSLASVTGTSTTPELPLDDEEAVENMQGNYSSLFLLYLPYFLEFNAHPNIMRTQVLAIS
jgi:hypothetical protein